jgi:hypothetical protein
MSITKEINEMIYLFGHKRGVVISEQSLPKVSKESLGDIYYQRCEGGEAIIDPESYVVSDVKTEDGKSIIKFVKVPRVGKDVFNNGESDSIGTCLGADEPMIERCWSVFSAEGKKIAGMEVDCSTGKDKW